MADATPQTTDNTTMTNDDAVSPQTDNTGPQAGSGDPTVPNTIPPTLGNVPSVAGSDDAFANTADNTADNTAPPAGAVDEDQQHMQKWSEVAGKIRTILGFDVNPPVNSEQRTSQRAAFQIALDIIAAAPNVNAGLDKVRYAAYVARAKSPNPAEDLTNVLANARDSSTMADTFYAVYMTDLINALGLTGKNPDILPKDENRAFQAAHYFRTDPELVRAAVLVTNARPATSDKSLYDNIADALQDAASDPAIAEQYTQALPIAETLGFTTQDLTDPAHQDAFNAAMTIVKKMGDVYAASNIISRAQRDAQTPDGTVPLDALTQTLTDIANAIPPQIAANGQTPQPMTSEGKEVPIPRSGAADGTGSAALPFSNFDPGPPPANQPQIMNAGGTQTVPDLAARLSPSTTALPADALTDVSGTLADPARSAPGQTSYIG